MKTFSLAKNHRLSRERNGMDADKEKKKKKRLKFPNYQGNVRKLLQAHIFYVLSFALGLLIFLIGVLSAAYELPQRFVDYNFQKNMILAPDSQIYPKWSNPDTPIFMRFYVFNVTNADEIGEGGKPRVKECGPYTYRMYTPKSNIHFYPNDTVGYLNNHTLVFQPNMSVGKEDDLLWHLNIPLASVGQMIDKLPSFLHYFNVGNKVLTSIGTDDLFTQHTVYEVIFGYKDPIFAHISKTMSFFGSHFDPTFGFFHKFNNSDDGYYLVHTGKKDFNEIQQIDRWNGIKSLPYWSTAEANMINGTDGSFLRPGVKRDEPQHIYFPQMCRSLKLEYENDSSVHGIPTFQFHFADDLLANADINPDNRGFCVPPDNCFDSGVLNVKNCIDGAEAFVSFPHFYNAAEKYQNAVIGLEPDKDKHDSVFHVEPMSGAVLHGDRKLQINFLLQPSKNVNQLKSVPKVIFPILWLGGGAEIGEDLASELRFVMNIVSFMDNIAYAMMASGLLAIALTVACLLRSKPCFCRSKYTIGLKVNQPVDSKDIEME